MSIQEHPRTSPRPAVSAQSASASAGGNGPATTPTSERADSGRRHAATGGVARGRMLAVLRITMGLTFLWAFLDKTFGLGYSTRSAQAWVNGGSPTRGFLAHVEVGPMQAVLRDWAGAGWADWLFMLALLGLGVALTLGVGLRISAVAGTVLLALMWIAEWPLARFGSTGAATGSTNPITDYHFVYLVVVIALAVCAAGDTWGLGRVWARLDIVGRHRWLR